MRSIKTRIILLNVIAMVVGIFVATLISAISISNLNHESSEQQLALLCETGKSNLNYYFESVEQSVNTVSKLIDDDLNNIKEDEYATRLHDHITRSLNVFSEAANNTNGVLTYYYRIDPEISAISNEKGFWYIRQPNRNKFIEHEVTDLTDESMKAPWFRIPKEKGESVWLPPYQSDNLIEYPKEYVVSYNVPVRSNSKFIGVVGIEISYHILGKQIENIKIHKNGFAYIVENENGSIIFHPRIDILAMDEADRPAIPGDFLIAFKNGTHHMEYTFEGVLKHAYWIELANGMSIVVAVPLSEVNEVWTITLIQIIVTAVVIVAAFTVLTIIATSKIVKPLKQVTEAATKINEGNFNVHIDYQAKNEIGTLTTAVNRLVDHLGGYISDLNNIAYADALTHVHNRSAYEIALANLQKRLDEGEKLEFAIAMFDCDDLKVINDNYGHDKGNVYLKNSSHLISRVFKNSEVYRLGGDEFVVILEGEDYKNRSKLKKSFMEKSKEISSFANESWEEIHVSVGVATYDPHIDKNVRDVVVHADHLMYAEKRDRKKQKM